MKLTLRNAVWKWLRLQTSAAGGRGSIHIWGINMPQAAQSKEKNIQKRKKYCSILPDTQEALLTSLMLSTKHSQECTFPLKDSSLLPWGVLPVCAFRISLNFSLPHFLQLDLIIWTVLYFLKLSLPDLKSLVPLKM